MGWMDKVKATAQDVAAEAKKATSQGKTKLDQLQVRKKADEAAKQLGYLTYRERAKGEPAGTEANRLVTEIDQYEAEIGRLQAQTVPAPPPVSDPMAPADPMAPVDPVPPLADPIPPASDPTPPRSPSLSPDEPQP